MIQLDKNGESTRQKHHPWVVSGGVSTPLHVGAMFVDEGGEREASLGTIAVNRPCTRPDRLRRPNNKVGMLP